MGFSTNDVVIVRDTFLHETINTTSATSLDVFVAANGTSRLLTLTLQ
jgi:hypothetical protein